MTHKKRSSKQRKRPSLAKPPEDEKEIESSEEEDAGTWKVNIIKKSFLHLLPKIANKHHEIYNEAKRFFPNQQQMASITKEYNTIIHPSSHHQSTKEFKGNDISNKHQGLTYVESITKRGLKKMNQVHHKGISGSSCSDEHSDNELKSTKRKDLKKETPENRYKQDQENILTQIRHITLRQDLELTKESQTSHDHATIKDDLFSIKKKSKQEIEDEDQEFKAFINQKQKELEQKSIGGVQLAQETLERYWKNPNLSKSEKFLRNYIINDGWKDVKDDVDVPSISPDEDEKELDKQLRFEASYNFRHEEEDPSSLRIRTYSRHQPRSLRVVKPTSRSLARKRRRERQKKEKEDAQRRYRMLPLDKRQKKMRLEQLSDAIGIPERNIKSLLKDKNISLRTMSCKNIKKRDYANDGGPVDVKKVINLLFDHKDKEGGHDEHKPNFKYEERISLKGDDLYNDDMEEETIREGYFRYKKVKPETYGLTGSEILFSDEKDLKQYRPLKLYASYMSEDDDSKARRSHWCKRKEALPSFAVNVKEYETKFIQGIKGGEKRNDTVRKKKGHKKKGHKKNSVNKKEGRETVERKGYTLEDEANHKDHSLYNKHRPRRHKRRKRRF